MRIDQNAVLFAHGAVEILQAQLFFIRGPSAKLRVAAIKMRVIGHV